MIRIIYLGFGMGLLLLGCRSPKAIYEKGQFKSVIRMLDKKAEKGLLSKEEILVFEKSLNDDLQSEKSELTKELASGEFEQWQEAYVGLDKLEEKQKRYTSYPQIEQGHLELIAIENWDERFADKLYDYHVQTFEQHHEKYLETTNKNDIIAAYYELERIDHFDRGEIETDSLLSAFAELGKRSFGINFTDRSFNAYDLRHLQFYMRPRNNQWSVFNHNAPYDYTVYVTMTRLDKEDQRTTSQRRYTNDVTVGTETITDANGNDVQNPIIETYTADVNEVAFRYTVNARVDVEIVWNKTGERVTSNFYTDGQYDERYEVYLLNGDLRAIPAGVNVNYSNPNNTAFTYDYSRMVEAVLKDVSIEVKSYLERY